MSTRKSITRRIVFLRQYREGRELSRSLRESLLVDVVLDGEDGWVVRSSAGSGNTTIEYVEGGDPLKVRFTLKLLPCTCLRGCQTVQVAVGDGQFGSSTGAIVWLPLISRLLLRNAVRLFVLRYANRIAEKVIGN